MAPTTSANGVLAITNGTISIAPAIAGACSSAQLVPRRPHRPSEQRGRSPSEWRQVQTCGQGAADAFPKPSLPSIGLHPCRAIPMGEGPISHSQTLDEKPASLAHMPIHSPGALAPAVPRDVPWHRCRWLAVDRFMPSSSLKPSGRRRVVLVGQTPTNATRCPAPICRSRGLRNLPGKRVARQFGQRGTADGAAPRDRHVEDSTCETAPCSRSRIASS